MTKEKESQIYLIRQVLLSIVPEEKVIPFMFDFREIRAQEIQNNTLVTYDKYVGWNAAREQMKINIEALDLEQLIKSFLGEKEEQPCDKFKNPPDSEQAYLGGDGYIHQCPICYGWRAFCGNCHSDHHKGGWQTCKEESRAENEKKNGN